MEYLDDLTVAAVCRLYDLGLSTAPPTRVFGGLLHRMYHLRTARGEFAVKVINPTILQYPNVREKFRLSERIAAAIAAAGIPAITALSGDGDVLHDIGEDTVMVYPWRNAIPPQQSPISAGSVRAHKIGSLLGRIHTLPLHFAELPPPEPPSPVDPADSDTAEWTALTDAAEQQRLPWAQELRALRTQIADWDRSAHEARWMLRQRGWVVSHSDLDQKNVLWENENTPYLIDWESAGYVQPAVEAVGAALDWSGQVVGDLDTDAFTAFLHGYRETASLTPQEIRYGLQAYCGNWCGWLKFSVQRAVGVATSDPEEQALGGREARNTLVLLHSAADTLPTLAIPD